MKSYTPNEKARIVLESLSTSTNMVKLCRRYNLHTQTAYTWKERFIENGKVGFCGGKGGGLVRTYRSMA